MGTRAEVLQRIVAGFSGAGMVRVQAMFGGHALYLDEKVIALIGDDTLFVKQTPAGRTLEPELDEAPPYPGAKPHLVVPEPMWEDSERMVALARATFESLPEPKPKKRPLR